MKTGRWCWWEKGERLFYPAIQNIIAEILNIVSFAVYFILKCICTVHCTYIDIVQTTKFLKLQVL